MGELPANRQISTTCLEPMLLTWLKKTQTVTHWVSSEIVFDQLNKDSEEKVSIVTDHCKYYNHRKASVLNVNTIKLSEVLDILSVSAKECFFIFDISTGQKVYFLKGV